MAYNLPSNLAREFTPSEVSDMKKHFKAFDADNSATIDEKEIKMVLKTLGENPTDAELKTYIKEADTNSSGVIEFGEFASIIHKMRKSGNTGSGFAKVVTKAANLFETQTASGGKHAFSEAEAKAFTEHVNNTLTGDEDLPFLPLDADSLDLFGSVRDGLLLCKLINKAVKDTVDERALNIPKNKKPLNIYQIQENQTLCVNAAKSIGCVVVNMGSNDLIEGTPHMVLGLLWQIVKIQLLSLINLKHHPELVKLLNDGEELVDLLALPPQDILLRWFNYHLKNAGSNRRVNNFAGDLQDSECYTILLKEIGQGKTDDSALRESDPMLKASHVIRNAKQLDVECFIQPENIVKRNDRMNLAFCAQIFNTCPGLSLTEEEEFELAGLLDDDEGDSREERVFRMWINSLGIDDLYVHNLFEDVRDGCALLRTLDKIKPGIVFWKNVALPAKNKFKKVANCNYAVVLGKQLKFSLVGIGGVDFNSGNKKLILAMVWQMLRYYTLDLLSSLGGGKSIEEKDIVSWAQTTVKNKGKSSTILSFRDKSLSNGIFLIDLLASIEPRIINWDFVLPGDTEEECVQNAKYVLSVARKLGCVVFCTWEDIVEVKPKMMMTFVASIMYTAKTYNKK